MRHWRFIPERFAQAQEVYQISSRISYFCIATLLAFLSISLLVGLSGCGGYKTFSLHRGIAHFSFEYPARYRVDKVEVVNDQNFAYTDVGLSWSPHEWLWRSSNILVFINRATDNYTSELAVKKRLDSENKTALDFRILESSTISVYNIKGYGAAYSWTAPAGSLGHGPRGEARPIVSRLAYFDYGGLSWDIYVSYDEATKDLGEADYEHVINTFKILK